MSIQLYAHNRTAYLKTERMLRTANRAAVIHPTGTGKSYIAFALCEAHPDGLILWISPSDYIYKTQRHNLQRSNPELTLEHVHFYTYTRLTLLTDQEFDKLAEKKPAYIILDEFHRAGAAVWGQSVSRLLMLCPDAKILGLSATSIRYLDNLRDMADELFDGQIASEITLGDAIADHILPAPIYVASFYQFGEELERLENQANATGNEYLRLVLLNKIKQAKRMIAEKQCGLPDIFKKHIKHAEGHYIVFCSSEERLDQAMEECDDWFSELPGQPDLHKYKVLSRYSSSRTEFDAFSKDNSPGTMKLLFCVDMLNEGIHMEQISGVIMLRTTESANVYYQQLGRALACSGEKKNHPLIFDLVNNFENTSAGSLPEGLIYQLKNEAMAGDDELDFEIYDYILDLQKALADIRATFEQSWDYSFQALQTFVAEQKRFPGRNEAANGVRLGDWCSVQRAQHHRGVLLPERTQKLEQLGFSWDLFEDAWNAGYEKLKAYVNEHGTPPRSLDDRASYNWLSAQRKAKQEGSLTPDHEALLVNLHVSLETNYSDARWQENCDALKDFLQQHGRPPIGSETQNGLRLGTWLYEQRRAAQSGELSRERQETLQQLGIRFDERRDRAFAENYELLCAFVRQYGRQPLTVERYQGFGLGAWCLRLREQYKNKELTKEQTDQLKEINFDFRPAREAKNAESWENRFLQLKEYLDDYGTAPKSREKPVLYRWLKKQKDALARGALGKEESRRLKECGLI